MLKKAYEWGGVGGQGKKGKFRFIPHVDYHYNYYICNYIRAIYIYNMNKSNPFHSIGHVNIIVMVNENVLANLHF